MATRLSGLCAERWDALVIGAGPAGGVAAALLASRGMRTLIVDRKGFPRAKVCGGCLAPAGVRALEGAGLSGALRTAGADQIGTLRVIARGASLPLPIAPYVTVERSRLDAALVEAACERGAHFAGGVRARVTAEDAVVLDCGRECGEILPGVVVVADGLGGSSLAGREDFAWRVDPKSPLGVGAVLPSRPTHADEGEITMVCARGGYLGAAPLGDGRWALAAALSPREVRDSGPVGAIGRVLEESGLPPPPLGRGSLCGAGQLTRRRARIALGRVLVVGDAAGYVQPLTGEGMSWAMVCASRIAGFAERAAQGMDVSRDWARECSRLLRWRGELCRVVCALASHPRALGAAMRLADGMPGAAWASRSLCWRWA